MPQNQNSILKILIFFLSQNVQEHGLYQFYFTKISADLNFVNQVKALEICRVRVVLNICHRKKKIYISLVINKFLQN